MTFADIINLWPTVAEFSRDVQQDYDKVKKWKRRNSIPCENWMRVVGAAKDRDIPLSLEMLARISERKAAS